MSDPLSNAEAPRVVHLDHTTVRGGAELALVRMIAAAQQASPREWKAAVLVPAIDDVDVFDALPSNVPRRIRGVRQGAGASSSPSRLPGLVLRLLVQAVLTRTHPLVRTADVVAANSTRAAAYAALALRFSRTPLVVHVRDFVDEQSLGAFGYSVMTRMILPRADAVIANSRATLATTGPFVRDDALAVVIPSAAGLHAQSLRVARSGPLRVGMLARIDPWKGQAELLEAFASAFRDGEEQLELAGGAPFEHADFAARLRARAAELGVADRVHLLGHVHDTADLLARWDIAVAYSTRPEPMGQNVLQYLAAGATTVVADEGGPAEWVDGRNGVRVPPRDADALARVLRDLAADPSRREALSVVAARTPGLLDDAAVAHAHATIFRALSVRRPRQGRA